MKLCYHPRTVLLTSMSILAIGCTDGPTMPPSDVAAPQFSPSDNRASPTQDCVEELFIDRGADPTHAGPGPHPTEESAKFKLTQGRISWSSGDAVKYEVIGTEAVSGGDAAVEDAVSTIGEFVGRVFVKDDGSPTTNPCGGTSRVVWEPIDGPGDILATASVCRNVVTKEIRGFVVTLDTEDAWSVAVAGEAGTFDVENVSAHEFGHVAGLGHVNGPKDGCLTMYKFAGQGEVQKRTLGLGDKLGMNALYGSADVVAGVCGL